MRRQVDLPRSIIVFRALRGEAEQQKTLTYLGSVFSDAFETLDRVVKNAKVEIDQAVARAGIPPKPKMP